MAEKTVYVVGYPKSGTTWLTRLMGDLLKCPTGGSVPEEDGKEIATEGCNRPNAGKLVVRKGHFRQVNATELVPGPHLMDVSYLEQGKHFVVHIIRDPRDICVSGAYHWRVPVEQFLDRMIRGDVARCGRWDEYVLYWEGLFSRIYDTSISQFDDVGLSLRYKSLVNSTDSCCLVTLGLMGHRGFLENREEISWSHVQSCVMNQSFEIKKGEVLASGGDLRENNMRKGEFGDYKNHFTPKMDYRIWSEFGDVMGRFLWPGEKLASEK